MPDDSDYRPNLPKEKKYLEEIAKEINKRAPLEDIKFRYLTDLLSLLGFREDPYKLVSLEDPNPESLQRLTEGSFIKLNSTELTDETTKGLSRMWDYLSESDPLEISNLLFVFGGPEPQRINEAIKLYKEGYASRILFTGQRSSYMKEVEVTEAEYYASVAEKQGVPKKDIILETKARNTPENAINSVKILKADNFLPSRIIIITLAYHMRRCYLTLKSSADWNPKIIRHPMDPLKFSKNDYFRNKDGWSYVFYEFMKLYGARLMGHF